MTNAQFKAAAKAEGVKIYSLRKTSNGYKISYAYELSTNTVSNQQDVEVNSHDLKEIFDHKFAGAATYPRF